MRQHLFLSLSVARTSLCRPGWPVSWRSTGLCFWRRLKACTTTPGVTLKYTDRCQPLPPQLSHCAVSTRLSALCVTDPCLSIPFASPCFLSSTHYLFPPSTSVGSEALDSLRMRPHSACLSGFLEFSYYLPDTVAHPVLISGKDVLCRWNEWNPYDLSKLIIVFFKLAKSDKRNQK